MIETHRAADTRPLVVMAVVLALMAGLMSMVSKTTVSAIREALSSTSEADARSSYAKSTLAFEENRGQADSAVRFVGRHAGKTVMLDATGAVLTLPRPAGAPGASAAPPDVLRVQVDGANPAPALIGVEQLSGVANYLIGDDPAQWRTNVPTYAKVAYRDVLPGVDMAWYGQGADVEYDLIVAPTADPRSIRVGYEGAERLSLGADGALLVHLPQGTLTQHPPRLYQEVDGARRTVEGAYVLDGTNHVSFAVGSYDATVPLVIDPVLEYSTYLGGALVDLAWDIAVDAAGNAYIAGQTASEDFPLPPDCPGSCTVFQPERASSFFDAFATKLDPAGQLVYSTYLGGTGTDIARGIDIDASGQAFVTGTTSSEDFPGPGGTAAPCTGDAGGDTCNHGSDVTPDIQGPDAFVAKLNSTGSTLMFSTYLGGSDPDANEAGECVGQLPIRCGEQGFGIAADPSGQFAYVAGFTFMENFPTTAGVGQPVFAGSNDVFVAKLDTTDVSPLEYSTYLGGLGSEIGGRIAIDSDGNAYVVGATTSDGTSFPATDNAAQPTNNGEYDVFVSKLNDTATALLYSTYLGGDSDDGVEFQGLVVPIVDIDVDSTGFAYVTGRTTSDDKEFPITLGAVQPAFGGGLSDAFVTKLDQAGANFVYSTFLGDDGADAALGIVVNSRKEAYVAGGTVHSVPSQQVVEPSFAGEGDLADACPPVTACGEPGLPNLVDGFVAKLAAGGDDLLYATLLGGGSPDAAAAIGVDCPGNAYITGAVSSADFPTDDALQAEFGGGLDAFATRLTDDNPIACGGGPGGGGGGPGGGDDDDDDDDSHRRGRITIVETSEGSNVNAMSVGSGRVAFGFHTKKLKPATFRLEDHEKRVFKNLKGGTYTVAQDKKSGWILDRIVCKDPTKNTKVVLKTRRAEIKLKAGEHVTCTFRNKRSPDF